MILGLRLTRGIDLEAIRQRTGICLTDHINPEQRKQLEDGGFLAPSGSHLQATREGLARLNAVISRLSA